MLKDTSIHRPIWMGFDDLEHSVSCRFIAKFHYKVGSGRARVMEFSYYDVEKEVQHC